MEIQRYNRQINNIGSATRCERRDGSEFLQFVSRLLTKLVTKLVTKYKNRF